MRRLRTIGTLLVPTLLIIACSDDTSNSNGSAIAAQGSWQLVDLGDCVEVRQGPSVVRGQCDLKPLDNSTAAVDDDVIVFGVAPENTVNIIATLEDDQDREGLLYDRESGNGRLFAVVLDADDPDPKRLTALDDSGNEIATAEIT